MQLRVCLVLFAAAAAAAAYSHPPNPSLLTPGYVLPTKLFDAENLLKVTDKLLTDDECQNIVKGYQAVMAKNKLKRSAYTDVMINDDESLKVIWANIKPRLLEGIAKLYPTAVPGGAKSLEVTANQLIMYNFSAGPGSPKSIDPGMDPSYTPLRMHVDPSWITLNIQLNPMSEYKGGGVLYPMVGMDAVRAEAGHGLVHPGFFNHQSEYMQGGVRYGLQVWVNCSAWDELTSREGATSGYAYALKRAIRDKWEPKAKAEVEFRLGRSLMGDAFFEATESKREAMEADAFEHLKKAAHEGKDAWWHSEAVKDIVMPLVQKGTEVREGAPEDKPKAAATLLKTIDEYLSLLPPVKVFKGDNSPPGDKQLQLVRAELLMEMKSIDEARKLLSQLIDDPSDAIKMQAYSTLVVLELSMGTKNIAKVKEVVAKLASLNLNIELPGSDQAATTIKRVMSFAANKLSEAKLFDEAHKILELNTPFFERQMQDVQKEDFPFLADDRMQHEQDTAMALIKSGAHIDQIRRHMWEALGLMQRTAEQRTLHDHASLWFEKLSGEIIKDYGMHPEDPWMEVTTISRGRASQAAASFDDTPDFDAPERTEAEEQARLSKIKPDPIVVAYMGYHLLRLNSHGAPSVLSSDGFDTPVQREMDIEKKAMAAFKQEAFGPDANPKVIVYMDELVDNLVALAEKIEQGVSTLRERGAKPTQEQQDLAARYKARAAAVREFMKSKGEKFGTPDIAKELHFPFTRWNEYDVEGEEEISMKQKDAPKAAAAGAEAAAAAPAAGEDLPGDNFQANAKYSVFTGDYYDSAPERALEDTELATIISERVQDAKAAEKIATYLIEKHKVVTNTAVNKLTAAQLAEAGMEKVSSDEFLLDVKSLGPPLEDPAPAEGKKADEL